ncbi:hypothetical protein F4819DRAFT_507761 [Hypoxylon fuscum]|nr:hypothetical protein F4819DRAFT_507761 [Hypoxylon fuscum]
MDEGTNGNMEDTSPGFIFHQDMTQDWVNMLDGPDMWVDGFGQAQPPNTKDAMPGLMDLSKLDTQLGSDKDKTLVSPEDVMSIDASAWPGLLYDGSTSLPGTEIQMPMDSTSIPQSSHMLPEGFPEGLFEITHGSGNRIEADNVGRVSLVIDNCNRDTLHHLLKLRGSLTGKTRIEIHNEE